MEAGIYAPPFINSRKRPEMELLLSPFGFFFKVKLGKLRKFFSSMISFLLCDAPIAFDMSRAWVCSGIAKALLVI